MIITCQECSTRFKLDESLLNPEGSKVRCSQCKSVFMASPPKADSPEPDTWELPDQQPPPEPPETNVFIPDGSSPQGDDFTFEDGLPEEEEPIESHDLGFQWEETEDFSTQQKTSPDPFDLDEEAPTEFPWDEESPEDKFSSYDDVLSTLDDLPEPMADTQDVKMEEDEEIPDFDDIPDFKGEQNDFNLPEFDSVEPDTPRASEPPKADPEPAPLETKAAPASPRPLIAPQEEMTPAKPRMVNTMIKFMMIICLLLTGALVVHFTTPYKLPYLPDTPMVKKLQTLISGKSLPPKITKTMPPPFPDQKSVKGHFVKNNTAGDLFIITGKVENPSNIAYHHVQVMGSLFKRNKIKAVSQVAFCGNVIPEERLKQGNITDIATQLEASKGMAEFKTEVPPGGTIPFMLVFSDLPKDLQNFTVKVVDFKK